MKKSDNPAQTDVLNKQYLRSILNLSDRFRAAQMLLRIVYSKQLKCRHGFFVVRQTNYNKVCLYLAT